MPAISRNRAAAKSLMCDTMMDLIKKKVGEQIVMNFNNLESPIIWERVQ